MTKHEIETIGKQVVFVAGVAFGTIVVFNVFPSWRTWTETKLSTYYGRIKAKLSPTTATGTAAGSSCGSCGYAVADSC